MCKTLRSWLHSAERNCALGVSYLSLHLHAVCPFMARCAMGQCSTCPGVVKVYCVRGIIIRVHYVRGVVQYRLHARCTVSYLPGPQVSLTVTGCVLRGIIAFTSRLAAPAVFFSSQEMEQRTIWDQIWVMTCFTKGDWGEDGWHHQEFFDTVKKRQSLIRSISALFSRLQYPPRGPLARKQWKTHSIYRKFHQQTNNRTQEYKDYTAACRLQADEHTAYNVTERWKRQIVQYT